MATEVQSVPPSEIKIDELTSGAEYVKQRRMVEILPDGQSDYGSVNGNYRATFNVGNSTNEFLDSLNSYFRCDLTVSTTAQASNTVSAHLDVGGIHSFIKSITIQTRSGVRIEYLDNYNKLYAMLRCATMSQNHVDSVQSMECGDSMGYRAGLVPSNVYKDDSKVAHVATALTAADVRLFVPARQKCADGSAKRLTFKLLSDFLSHLKYIPLPMMKQLQIIIEFERPALAAFLVKRLTADGTALQNIVDADTISYSISNFRFVANYVEMADVVMAEYERAYEGPGISIPFQSYRAFRTSVVGASSNVEIQFGCNSARFLLMAIMNNYSFSESNNSKAYQSNSIFLKDGMKSYRVQSGGKVFPANAPVSVETNYAAEAFTQLMIALNQHQNTLSDTSIRHYEWESDNTFTFSGVAPIALTDSTKFLLGVDLTDIDQFSGLNTNGNNLVVDLQFTDGRDPATVGRNLLAFVCYDSALTVQKELGVLVRY